jgi:hypothetical protein
MVQASRSRAAPVREYNPVFEEAGFSLGRDYDPDRVRAEQRKLKRQLQKEKRGEGWCTSLVVAALPVLHCKCRLSC